MNMLGFMGCYGNSKDTLEARRDVKDIHRNEQDPEEDDGEEHDYLGPASYTLSKRREGHHV